MKSSSLLLVVALVVAPVIKAMEPTEPELMEVIDEKSHVREVYFTAADASTKKKQLIPVIEHLKKSYYEGKNNKHVSYLQTAARLKQCVEVIRQLELPRSTSLTLEKYYIEKAARDVKEVGEEMSKRIAQIKQNQLGAAAPKKATQGKKQSGSSMVVKKKSEIDMNDFIMIEGSSSSSSVKPSATKKNTK